MIAKVEAKPFFRYARLRELRRVQKIYGEFPARLLIEAHVAMEDPVLNAYRFCNVHREDDTTTRWIRHNITPEVYGPRLLGALVIARWFNRVSTLGKLQGFADQRNLLLEWPKVPDVGALRTWHCRVKERLAGVAPIVTGAYIIKTPTGIDKLEGVLWALERFLPDAEHLQVRMEPGETTLEGVQEVLRGYPFMGPFMAYEVVTDLRHTPMLAQAPDIMTWASAGPGAARGLARLIGVELDHFRYGSAKDQGKMIALMRCLLQHSQDPDLWPAEWKTWEMREVEHTLCEFDKYQRALLGEGRPRQLYRKI